MGNRPETDADSLNGVFLTPNSSQGFSRRRMMPDHFSRLCIVGRGRFSTVYLVRKKTNRRYYAMKVMEKQRILDDRDVENVLVERNLLSCFSHPFIVSLHYAFQTTTQLYLLLDYVNGGELYYHLSKVRRFPESRVRLYVAEIALALSFLHSNKVIYRDLKLENVLLDAQGHCIVTDFNFCKLLKSEEERAKTFCGTIDYIAPEVLLATQAPAPGTPPSKVGYSYPVDYWSLGVLTYELLCGLPPFYAEDAQTCYSNILRKRMQFPSNVPLSRPCRDFIKRCLTRDPDLRITSDEILSHPWFDSLDWPSVLHRRIIPEYVPDLDGCHDTRYVDSQFLAENPHPPSSSQPIPGSSRANSGGPFLGFSFTNSLPPPGSGSGSISALGQDTVPSPVDINLASLQDTGQVLGMDLDQIASSLGSASTSGSRTPTPTTSAGSFRSHSLKDSSRNVALSFGGEGEAGTMSFGYDLSSGGHILPDDDMGNDLVEWREGEGGSGNVSPGRILGAMTGVSSLQSALSGLQ